MLHLDAPIVDFDPPELASGAPAPPLVLGVDSGFAHFGWCLARVLRTGCHPLAFGVIETEPDDCKVRTLAPCDNFARARRIADELEAALSFWATQVRLVCYEAISIPQNAQSAYKVGIGFGVLSAACSRMRLDVPALEVSPMKLKKAVTGSGTASKVEIGRALATHYALATSEPNKRAKLAPPWTPLMGERLAKASGEREHAWDALGAIHACTESDLMKILRPAT